jgi:hypothetical protein
VNLSIAAAECWMRGRQLALAAQRKDPHGPLPRRLNPLAIKPWTGTNRGPKATCECGSCRICIHREASRKSRAKVVSIDAPLETCAVWRRLKLHPAREIYLIEMGTMVKKMGKFRKHGAAAMAA